MGCMGGPSIGGTIPTVKRRDGGGTDSLGPAMYLVAYTIVISGVWSGTEETPGGM